MAKRDTAFFISDAHLGDLSKYHPYREKRVLGFLRSSRDRATHLFIVGDLFDFWIEYKHAIRPEYFPVLRELSQWVDDGVEVHYLAGNHDFALGPFLHDYIGITVHPDHVDTVVQGRKIHLHHGDGLLRDDYGYRILRAILRNPINQRLYRMLHPNIGVPLAIAVSGSSRHLMNRRCGEGRLRLYRAHAREYLDKGSDIVIFAHTHSPEMVQFENGVYCNTGDWYDKCTYVSMQDGNIGVWRDNPEGDPQPIGPVPGPKG